MSIKNKTEFLECLRFKRESSSYRTEKRGFCVLSLRLSGNAKFIFDNKSVVVTPKNILFIPGNATYFQQAEKEEIIAIHFNAPHQNSHTLKVYTPKNFEHIKHLFIRLAETYSAMNDGYIFKANALFYELIFSLYTEQSNNTDKTKRISASIEYIHKNFNSPTISVKQIAEQSFMSEVYFRRIFRSCFDKSPIKYINNLRINHAKNLLAGNYMTIYEVAKQCGFANEKYFSRVFSQQVGVSPGQFSKNF